MRPRYASLLLWVGIILPSLCAQDLSIYGKFNLYVNPVDTKELGYITTKCYNGLMLSSCIPKLQENQFERDQNVPYYNKLKDKYGVQYCAQCCGTDPSHIDVWDLSCDMDVVTARETNVYGYELRIAAKKFDGDKSIVTCPLKRSACEYDGQTTLHCNGEATDTTYLHGYTVTLTVQMMDENFAYWRSVSKCEIEAVESNTPLGAGDIFNEKIIFIHLPDPANSKPDAPKILLTLIAVYFLSYMTLYYFRRKKCVYCQGKLVFSKELCYKCKFVGAKPLDPFLLAALEEKGDQIQGEHPDRLPGSRACVKNLLLYRDRALLILLPWLLLLGLFKTKAPVTPSDSDAIDVEDNQSANPQVKFKYPKWLKWFKKWRRKRLERLEKKNENPNILPHPKHIIFEAVGHHDPPEMDEESIAARKLQIIDALGFNPEDYEDEKDHESKSDSPAMLKPKTIPDWQKAYVKRDIPGAELAAVSSALRQQLRRGFIKQRNKGPPIQWRFVLPFVAAIVGLIIILVVGAAIVTGAVNFQSPTSAPDTSKAGV